MQRTPLWRDARRLLLLIEQAVCRFPRYHKYTLGSELRQQSMHMCRLIQRAFNQRDSRKDHVEDLVTCLDDLKLQIQLAKELQAFRNLQEFETIATLAVGVGRQSGGWRKRLQENPARTAV